MPEFLLLNILPAFKFHCLKYCFLSAFFHSPLHALSFLGVTVGYSVGQATVHAIPTVP